jgi:hypothetical protein
MPTGQHPCHSPNGTGSNPGWYHIIPAQLCQIGSGWLKKGTFTFYRYTFSGTSFADFVLLATNLTNH